MTPTTSPSSSKARSVPSDVPSGSRPFQIGPGDTPVRLPADPGTGPEVSRSPVRSGAPLTDV